ncbi:MAG TPA: Dabb family protein [Tepidisphaeraceae bacterium]|nr:Dabb family protein [Tepidisphaeraceae bacterium]
MFVHTVFFWMKPGVSDADRKKLVSECMEFLGAVPTVRQIWAGVPAQTPRDVVDNSYDVGLTVVLDDKAGHDVYQEHASHLEFIKRNKHTWERVRVYDYLT